MDDQVQEQIISGKLKQSWSHIEDEIEPSDGRLVFKVQDYYIEKDSFKKDNSLPITPSTAFFVGFKVRNKNSGKELSFIEDYSQNNGNVNIIVNLGPSSDWSPVDDTNDLHVKLEYEYIEYWPIFKKRSIFYPGTRIPIEDYVRLPQGKIEKIKLLLISSYKDYDIQLSPKIIEKAKHIIPDYEDYDIPLPTGIIEKIKLLLISSYNDHNIRLPQGIIEKIKLILIPGYTGQFIMSGDSQGELSITVPLGMNIYNAGKSTEIIFYEGPVNKNTPQIEMGYNRPHITSNEGKLKYHYIIDDISYNYVLETIQEKSDTNFFIEYNVVNDIKFFLMLILAITVFSVTLFVDWNGGNWYYFVVILLSISTLYLTLRKEKYQIPLNKITSALIFLSVPFLGLKPFILEHSSEILIIVGSIDIVFFIYSSYIFKSLVEKNEEMDNKENAEEGTDEKKAGLNV